MLMFGFTQQICLMGYLNCILYLPILTIRKEKHSTGGNTSATNERKSTFTAFENLMRVFLSIKLVEVLILEFGIASKIKRPISYIDK